MGKKGNVCRILVGKSGAKRLSARPGYRWEVNIKIDVEETEWKSVGCSCLANCSSCCKHDNETGFI
jgi:hypothetical protein